MNNEDRASEILSRLGLELPSPWEGSRPVWHAWHLTNLMYLMTYREYLNRVVEIAECKPPSEQEQRLRSMKPVAHHFDSPAYAAWRSAEAEWRSAYAAWQRANTAWRSANTAWRSAEAEEILEAHAAECRDCGWNGEAMVFSNG